MTERRPLFHTHIVVDWSARSKPSPKRPSKDAIWWALAHPGAAAAKSPEYARTRDEALCRIARLVAHELDAGRRVLVGFDFPFGYPSGVAERLTGQASARALWDWLAERIEDAPDNANNRYEVVAKMNGLYPGLGPFWGRHPSWSCPAIPQKASERTEREAHPEELRIADRHAKGTKTVWQLAYAGSVGAQVRVNADLGHATDLVRPRTPDRSATTHWDVGSSPSGLQELTDQISPEPRAEWKTISVDPQWSRLTGLLHSLTAGTHGVSTEAPFARVTLGPTLTPACLHQEDWRPSAECRDKGY